ncbi:dTDP-4-amino-4,6-dideoxygalactose transaminase [Lacibacter cauensis]|uniref:dTDP-4-amino-4,6-dideoxygalactose transaminase n=1 Tax=Lacibacter cauensis TaxID=510947 RepID=A0A562SJI4_9BACT|nr:DegT/DnrJ/EryC1/StrS family aminotransferase [Lacibacter cauensis]TWI81415.1 dTDP-4-amino-4,6-dideoxygalactose transaminase [Lacibacter cauensis]
MKKIPFVDLSAQYQSIRPQIDTAMQAVMEQTAFIGGNNPFVQEFEKAFAAYLGVQTVVSCANGTDSLEILLKAYGVGPDDEVIVPAMSWISTSEVVSAVGAKPVFVDIDPVYYTIDPSKIEAAITAKTKAIIPVHLYGQVVDMDPVMELSKRYDLWVIEDCAQAHGALYKGRMAGTIGHASSFSFYPGKNLGAYGDAGGIATNDVQIATICRMIANHGQQGKHNHVIEGRNSRMDGLQAAVLSAKLPFLPGWTLQRIAHASQYDSLFQNSAVVTAQVRPQSQHVFHLYVIQVANRTELSARLKEQGIETAIHYPRALPFLPCYAKNGYTPADFPVAASFQEKIISLPMFAELTEAAIAYVSAAVKQVTG